MNRKPIKITNHQTLQSWLPGLCGFSLGRHIHSVQNVHILRWVKWSRWSWYCIALFYTTLD